MDKPKIAKAQPCYMTLQKGRSYLWCSCGLSKKQPFCDFSHKGTKFEPVKYTAEFDEEILFCNCKQTKNGPHCDGSHNNLPGGYADDDPNSIVNKKVEQVTNSEGPITRMDGDCYVFSKDRADWRQHKNIAYTPIITPDLGAQYQSQFYLEASSGASPFIHFGDKHVVLYTVSGSAEIQIGDRQFELSPRNGFYVCPKESFRIHATEKLGVYLSVCPGVDDITFSSEEHAYFNETLPIRTVGEDTEKRKEMAVRYFQLLVDKTIGSEVVTQFIGHIPQSKAKPHRHLYEEALIILSGEGMMWTETKKTAVKPGDVIFLPRKQVHSLQGTNESGMDVVGVIYPGDNPSINY